MSERGIEGLLVDGLRVSVGAFTLTADLRVAPGEVVAVVGPNGAGKTTLLRALAGLAPIAAGRVSLGGRLLDDTSAGAHLPPQQRSVAVVFQDVRLFPRLDVRANVAFGPRARGVARNEAHAIAERHLADVGLAGLAGRRPDALSGGEAQRVGLARALATDPSLLLLDEPLAAVDLSARDALRDVLRERLAVLGRPALLVTHDPADALSLTERLVVLDEGRIVQDASAEDVRKDPGSAWVARMLRG
jgi:molybdate transport system ATP-binding protein